MTIVLEKWGIANTAFQTCQFGSFLNALGVVPNARLNALQNASGLSKPALSAASSTE
jgi:hypothetical protein